MATYKAVLHHRKKLDGTKRVMIRITINRKPSYLATEFYLEEKYWNENKGEVKISHEMHAKYNFLIQNKIRDLQSVEVDELLQDNNLSAIEIKKIAVTGPEDFFSYFDKKLKVLKETRAENTYERNYYSLVKIKKYAKDKLNKNKISFKEINGDFIDKYYSYLLSKDGLNNSPATANKEMETISGVISSATKRGIVKNYINPFLDFKKKKSVTTIDRLDIDEVDKLYFSPITGLWALYRDIWLTMFYSAGMRVSDAIMLKVGSISGDRLNYAMNKTKKNKSILVGGRLLDIINQYSAGKQKEDYLFVKPKKNVVIKNHIESQTSQMNKIIKEVAKYREIKKKIKTHTARHSFANIALKKINDIYALMELLGHSDVRMTQRYVASLDLGENDELMGKVFT